MSFPLKTGADLYNQELRRARLHNESSDPTEYGKGTIYFNTSTDLNTKDRVRVMTDGGWQTLAYREELDFANSKEFKDLEEKVDAFLDGEVNSDDVLDNLKEIQAFLNNYSEATNLAEILNGKLNTSGGEMAGRLTMKTYIRFNQHNDTKEYLLGMTSANGALNWYNGTQWNEIIHGGNYVDVIKNNTLDINILRNAGSATKLADNTAFTAWGQTFFKDGKPVKVDGILRTPSGKSAVSIFDTEVILGYGEAAKPLTTYVDGSIIYLRTTADHIPALIVNGNKNVTIGSKDDAGADAKLYVDGQIKTLGHWGSNLGVGDISTTENHWNGSKSSLLLCNNNNALSVLVSAKQNERKAIIQVGHSSTEYADSLGELRLNPFGGLVSIGAGGLNVGGATTITGDLYVEGNIIATKEVSAGGSGEEGGGESGFGLSLLEDWDYYDSTKAQALGAVLGYDLKSRIADLESKATQVSVQQTITAGKEIGKVTIDGNTTKLYAPANYAWNEISGTPNTIEGYGITNAITTAGGTITGNLLFDHTATKAAGIKFKDNRIGSSGYSDNIITITNASDETCGVFGLLGYASGVEYYHIGHNGSSGNNLRIYKDKVTFGADTLLHTGNYATFIDKTHAKNDGSNASGTWGIAITGSASSLTPYYVNNLDNALENRFFHSGFQAANRPATNYGTGFTISNSELGYLHQLAFDSDNYIYARRKKNDTWDAWKQLAFTDSDITGNAATATKLKNSVSLWGNNFNGTQSLSGGMFFDNGADLRFYNSEKVNLSILKFSQSNNLVIGGDVNKLGADTYLGGKKLHFRTGEDNNTAMLINSSGNVLIGITTDDNSGAKLQVNGGISGSTLTLGSSSASGTIFLQRPSHNYIWASYAGGVIHLGTKDVGNTSSGNASLSVYGNNVRSGDRNNAVSLGTSSQRWSNVYSVLGNFSSRVLVGGAPDNEGRALNVSGNAGFTGYVVAKNIEITNTDSYPAHIQFNRVGANYLAVPEGGSLNVSFGAASHAATRFLVNNDGISTTGNAIISGATTINGKLYANAGAEINGDLIVRGNVIAEKEVSAGGAGSEMDGESGGSGGGASSLFYTREISRGTTTIAINHGLKTSDIVVCLYEQDNLNTSQWNMCLTDIEITDIDTVNIHFGSATTQLHKVVIMGAKA